jgi:positive regulator of sigma E activity
MEGLLRFIVAVAIVALVIFVVLAVIVPTLGLNLPTVIAALVLALLGLGVWFLRRISRDD